MRSDDRRSTRTLVRWNDDLDKSILLFINYACVEAGIKIPFARVAELMGPRFSEGAIVQHIAKVRSKMQDEKERSNPKLLVPPPNKRGSVAKSASAMCYGNSRQRKSTDLPDLACSSNTRSNRMKVKRELEDDGDDHNRDNEWATSSAKKSKRVSPKETRSMSRPDYPRVKNSMTYGYSVDACSPKSTPIGPRGRIKVNHASMVDGVSDNEESGANDLIQLGEEHGHNAKLSTLKASPSHKAIPPNGYALQGNHRYPTTLSMDFPTLHLANSGLTPSFENGAGGFGELPVLPDQHELDPFADTNFNGSSIPANAGFSPYMRSDVPLFGSGDLGHDLPSIFQTTSSNNSAATLAPSTVPLLAYTDNNNNNNNSSVFGHEHFPTWDNNNWDSIYHFEDERLPSPNYSEFLNFDSNSVV